MRDSIIIKRGSAAANGCVYCRAAFHPERHVGERVYFLSGHSIGTWGTVVPDTHTLRADEYSVSPNYDETSVTTCHLERDLALPVKAFIVPTWAPPLCMEDSFHLHASLTPAFLLPEHGADERTIADALVSAISCCWSRRLPISDDEIWAILSVHGISKTYEKAIRHNFDFGLELAIKLNGKKANKQRRISPMSRIRHLTSANQRQWHAILKYDNTPQMYQTEDGRIYLRGATG